MINDFRGSYRWLSNFHLINVTFDGVIYRSTEHAYRAAKTYDIATRKRIQAAATCPEARKLGQGPPKGITICSPDWESRKLEVMEDLLRQKFAPNTELARLLLETGDQELIEGNWWGDVYWGVCNGKGSNHLGKLLMKIRKELH